MDDGAQLSDGDEFDRNAEATTTLSGGLALRKPSHRKYRRRTLSRSPSPHRSAGRVEDNKLSVEEKNRTVHSPESSAGQTFRENADSKRRANDLGIQSGDRVVASGDLGAKSKIEATPESTTAGKNDVEKGYSNRNAEMKDNHGPDDSGHNMAFRQRRDEYVEEKSGNGRGDRRWQGRDEIGGREKDREGLEGRRDKGGSRYSGYQGGRNLSRRDDHYGRDRDDSRDSSRDYRDSGRDSRVSGRDSRDSGRDYKDRESGRDHHDGGRDYKESGRNSRDSGRGARAVHGDYGNRRRVEGGRDDSRYSRDRLQHREKYVDKVPSRDEYKSRDRSNSRDGNRRGNREASGASPVLHGASGKDADSFERDVKDRKDDRRDNGDVSTDKDDGDDEENRDLHEEKNLGQDRIKMNSSFPVMTDNDSVGKWNKRGSGGDVLGVIEEASLQLQKANSTEVENCRKRKGTAFEKSSQAQDRGLLEVAEVEKETALADHRMTEVEAPAETTPDQTLMTKSAPVSDLTMPRDVLSQGTSQQENLVVSQGTDADFEAKARAAKAAIRASKWGPPANQLPQAVLPRPVPPQAALPRPVLPQAVLPRAIPPQAVLPQLVTPQAVPPQGLLPLPSQNCGVVPQIAALLAARKAAELVNASMGVPGSMSADEKKRLLWGSKKAAVVEEPSAAVGTNRWDTAHFADREREEKFQKLMGVKTEKMACEGAKSEPANGGTAVAETNAAALTEEKQREIQEELEKQFSVGLRRRDGRTVGLGL